MRRSVLLQVAVYCPHFQRTVEATRNEATDRLVACKESDACRDPAPASAWTELGSAERSPARGGPGTLSGPPPQSNLPEHARPYPRGCPVFPSLAK